MKPLHDKKHTLAKRGLSLLCILALCLGLLPATALAAGEDAPNTLWVGETQITTSGYWTTDTNGKLTAGDASNYNVHYDGNGILTLKNANIQGRGNISEGEPIDYGIYAASTSGQSVALTINLIGSNTVKGYCGIYVGASDGDSALVIQSDTNDRLETSGSGWNGITMSSNLGNVSLTINNASVEASTERTNYYGVSVTSNAGSPTISLTVNGGSLTAQGDSGLSGIRYFFQKNATDPSISLMVQNNAWVKAMPGIATAASMASKPTIQGNGIVFDGTEGTVYGNVTLDNPLTVGEGETLTIPEGSTLNANSKLTNNGTINVEDGGKLEGEPGGTIVSAPTITTESLPAGTVNQPYTAPLTATGNNIAWSVSGDLPAGLTLDTSTGTISGTPTTDGQFQVTVTATNSAGSIDRTYTLNIKPAKVSVTGVKLDQTELALYTGDTATLNAMVAPGDATNKNVTWSSDKPEVATVDANGKITAKGEGEATITVRTADGNHTATCTVKVTDPVYGMTTDTTALNFGSAYTGYAQPAAQTVTVKNTGNQQVTVTLPTANDFIITAGTGFTDGSAAIKPGETATFTVQPKTGLSAGTYNETIEVTGTEGAAVTIPASFTVKSRPSYNPPTVSEKTIDAIQDAQPGETVTVDLSGGDTTLDKEVFETLAGKDVSLVVDLGDGLSWTVNGSDIPEDATLTDIDMGVTMNSDGIPVEVVNAITGERDSVQITLAHDGAFGFTMTLTAPLGAENAGYWANLYHYDEDAEALNFEAAAKIDEDGNVTIPFSHASQYAIVIDTHSHATVDVSDLFIDIAPDAWYKDAVQYAYDNGLMTGVSATEFAPEATTTRAMIVSILARLENVTTAEAAGFADVDDNDWYATAVNWAANVGVVNGYEDNTFRPNTAITREQLAAILMNYANYKGQDTSARAALDNYTDQPSTWAQEAMQWAVAEGLISGVTNDQLQPQGNATRAQVAAILQRFLDK